MLGMGSLEILVILLISFLLLGPQKMISGARVLGDLIAEAKRFTQQIPHIDLDEAIHVSGKEDIQNGSELSDNQLDANINSETPIAFESRRKRKVSPARSELEPEEFPNNQEAGSKDSCEKTSWG